jgi:two-component system, chemotaxis family, chemotaxis protein CheY
MQKYNLSQVNVLIIDSNWNMRRLVGTALEGYGIQNVEFAADGREGLNKLVRLPIDLVICEYRLGRINGIDLTRKIRRSRKKFDPFVPILLLTADTEEGVVAAARDAGISGVIAKPVSAEYLYRHIVELIERPRQFVRTSGFIGPDRRLRDNGDQPDTPKRRTVDRFRHGPPIRIRSKSRGRTSSLAKIRDRETEFA